MRRKKLLKIVGIGLALVVGLVLLFVVAFIFNPFEGSLTDMRELVPRNVDFFVRKVDLRDDFEEFPEPAFWERLEASPSWSTLRRGSIVQELRGSGLDEAIDGLRRAAAEVQANSAGLVSLLRDVLGREVILAGRLPDQGSVEGAHWAAWMRVSWRIRFVMGLLEWDSVRARLREQGTVIERRPDGVLTMTTADGTPLWITRHLDCVLATNDEELLADSLRLAEGDVEVESFGSSSDYRDGIESRVTAWRTETGLSVQPLEAYLRPDRLFPLTHWDDGWPDPRNPESMNERVLASFLNLQGWRFLTNSILFEPDSLTLLGRIDLNRNMHTGFQAQFFKEEPQSRDRWLDPFLALVPDTACAAAAIRMPAGDFLQEMWQAVDPEIRRDVDDLVLSTGTFEGVSAIVDKLRDALQPRVGVVFHRTREIGGGIESFDPSPAPHVAWVFWIDPRFRDTPQEIYDFLSAKWTHLKFTNAYDLQVTGGAAREYVNPNIPVTGEIALLLWRDFFVVSNSGPLIRDMINRAHVGGSNLLATREYAVFSKELADYLSGFVYLDAERLAHVVGDYQQFLDAGSRSADQGWMLEVRPQVERDVLRSRFSAYRTVDQIPEERMSEFEAAVENEMQQRWLTVREQYVGGDRARLEQLRALLEVLGPAYVQLRLDPQTLEWKSRVMVDLR